VSLPLPNADEALIGRADAVSGFFPDIDLTPYGGIESGVGRQHVRLLVQGGQVLVEDQDSTNGTFVNGARLSPRTPHPVNNGDEIRLGALVTRLQL
jgi:pSer/pThr/pTyr-binding forkhead associated (FHA) protein